MNINEYLKAPVGHEIITKKILFKNDKLTIFDIGSCEGEDSIRYKKKFPNSNVYAFEPLNENLKKIRRNLKSYNCTSVVVVPFALSNITGEAEFHVSSGSPSDKENSESWDYGNKSSSLLAPKEVKSKVPWLKFDKRIKIRTVTLKEFCRSNSIDSIDLIHMDVQGAEKMVLEGAGDMLHKTKCIWLEVEKVELYRGQPLQADIEEFLTGKGFTKVLDDGREYDGDQLYVRTELAETIINSQSLGYRKRLVRILDRLRKPTAYKRTSYSQSGEDIIVKFIFDAIGVARPSYLDIGAHHPDYINNTKLFYDLGATGVNIEPDPCLYALFPKSRPKDTNLNIGVGEKSGELTFYTMDPPTLNTFSKKEAERYVAEYGFKITAEQKLAVSTISEVVERYCNGVFPDFLSIDVEGLDYELVRSIDYTKSTPTVICVETITYSDKGMGVKQQRIIDYLKTKGYMIYADTNINTILVKRDKWERG